MGLICGPGARHQTAMVNTRTVAATAVFTAFVFVTTFSLAVTTSTGGYFDVGEIMVYITALVMGPYVGAFAGGVGSAMSDALLAPQFAPGTLVIKAGEGFIVGYLSRRGSHGLAGGVQKGMGAILGAAVAAVVFAVGLISFPDASLLFGGQGVTPTVATAAVPLSVAAWAAVAAVAFAVTWLVSRRIGPRFTWIALAIFIGGAEMVAGYFLYETGVLRIGFAAPAAEVPVNALQAILGLIVAPPVASRVQALFRRAPAVGTPASGREIG